MSESDLIGDDGRIKGAAVATSSITLIAAAFFEGVSDIVEAVFDFVFVAPAQGFAAWFSTVIELYLSTPSEAVSAMFRQTAEWTQTFGVMSFVAATAFVAILAYIVARGLRYV